MKKFLEEALVGRWYLHLPVGNYVMIVLMFLLSFSNMRDFEIGLVSLLLLFIGCAAWEIVYQQAILKATQTVENMVKDVVVGVAGGVLVIISDWLNIRVSVTVMLTVLGIVGMVYKKQ
jgi:hypothetical protein